MRSKNRLRDMLFDAWPTTLSEHRRSHFRVARFRDEFGVQMTPLSKLSPRRELRSGSEADPEIGPNLVHCKHIRKY